LENGHFISTFIKITAFIRELFIISRINTVTGKICIKLKPMQSYLFYSLALLIVFVQNEIRAEQALKEFYLECPHDSFAYIYENYDEDYYITVTLSFEGTTWYSVKLRIRGDTSRKYPKKSLKLKFEGDPFVNNRDKLNLNADYYDKSYIHAFLTTQLFQKTGHPCAELEHVRVYLNNKYLGLYILLENVDDAYLEARNLDANGNLYKASRDNSSMSIYDDIYNVWEKKSDSEESWDDLLQLIRQINDVSESNYFAFTNEVFDYEKMINILAINMLVANGSTYYHNYYLYHDIKSTSKWLMMPWDLDKTFSAYNAGYRYDRSATAYNHDNPFLERAIIDPAIFSDIRKRIDQLAGQFFNNSFFDPIIDSLHTLLAPSVEQDLTDDVADSSEWVTLLDAEKRYIRDRVSRLTDQFTSLPRPFRALPTANTFTSDIVFRWHPSFDPNGDPITYMLKYSTDLLFKSEETVTYENITDTVFVLPENPAPGTYYWIVYATDGSNYMPAYDSKNSFTYKIPTTLPATIDGRLHLAKEQSPYLAQSDITITASGKLVVDAGVEIRFKEHCSLYIYGQANFNGTQSESIRMVPELIGIRWGALCIGNAAGSIILNHVLIDHAGTGADTLRWKAAVTSYNSTLRLKNTEIKNVIQPVYAYGGDIEIEQCEMIAGPKDDIINLRYGKAIVRDCNLYGMPVGDAIDYDHIIDGLIENNTIVTSTDDGIDIGEASQNIQIQRNLIMHCNDKAISVGEQSTATIYQNCILDNNWGVAVKDSSYGFIDHNTFYRNGISILCYEKVNGQGPGKALATNNIFSQSQSTIFELDSMSTLEIHYSLSDTHALPGDDNLNADPGFLDTANSDFRLQPESPCINSGDPEAALDPDGTRSDIGAYYFNLNAPDLLVINEINYNSSQDYDTGDWLELYNPSELDADLGAWRLQDQDSTHTFILAHKIVIAAKKYMVICRDTSRFRKITGLSIPLVGNFDFGFSNGGDVIKLYEATGALVDSVCYQDKSPWPVDADGTGKTLELIDFTTDNNWNENWKSSLYHGGTPGKTNSVSPASNNSSDMPRTFILTQNYPNPFNTSTMIPYTISEPGKVEIIIYDLLGRVVEKSEKKHAVVGTFSYQWHAKNRSSGIYFFIAKWDGKLTQAKKAVLIK
jgi:hypothetical protein